MSIIYRYMAWGFVVLALIVTAGVKGYVVGADEVRDKAEAQANAARAKDAEIATGVQAQLDTDLNRSHALTPILLPEVPRVVNHYIPVPGAATQARPAYFLTAGAVSLWNHALQGAGPASGADAAAPSASDFDLTGIDFSAAEQNAILNFGQYRDCRIVVQGWQDWYRGVSKP